MWKISFFTVLAKKKAGRTRLARWFRYAEQALVWAIARREELQEIVAKLARIPKLVE